MRTSFRITCTLSDIWSFYVDQSIRNFTPPPDKFLLAFIRRKKSARYSTNGIVCQLVRRFRSSRSNAFRNRVNIRIHLATTATILRTRKTIGVRSNRTRYRVVRRLDAIPAARISTRIWTRGRVIYWPNSTR